VDCSVKAYCYATPEKPYRQRGAVLSENSAMIGHDVRHAA
jgi:hypothetical protein